MNDKEMNTINEKQEYEIKRLVEEGYGIEEIAKKFGVKPLKIVMVVDRLKSIGFLKEGEKQEDDEKDYEKTLTQEQKDIKELKEKGYTNEEVSTKLNLKLNKVNKIVRFLCANDLLDENKINQIKQTKKRQLNPRRQEIKQLLEEGYRTEEIAQKLNCDKKNVDNIYYRLRHKDLLDEEKIKKNRKPKPINLTEMQTKIKELYEKGYTNEEIAKVLGRKKQYVANTIYNFVRRNIVEKRKKDRFKLTNFQLQVKELIEKGHSYKEIADITGHSFNSVANTIYILRQKELLNEEKIQHSRYEKIPEERCLYEQEVKRLIEEGYSYQKIANETGHSKFDVINTVTRLRKKGQLDENIINKYKEKNAEYYLSYKNEVKRLREEGYSYNEIAAITGHTLKSVTYVIHILNKSGNLDKEKSKEEKRKNKSDNKKHIVQLAKMLVSNKQYEEAIKLFESIDENKLNPNEIETIKKIKKILQDAQRTQGEER